MEICSVHILCNNAGGQNKNIRAPTLRYSVICLQEHALSHEGQATRHLKVESSSVRASHTYFLNWSEYCHSQTTFTFIFLRKDHSLLPPIIAALSPADASLFWLLQINPTECGAVQNLFIGTAVCIDKNRVRN